MKQAVRTTIVSAMIIACCSMPAFAEGFLSWPIACIPGLSCLETKGRGIGYPDIRPEGATTQCRAPAYKGHTGTDIYVASVDDNMPVMAAADGEVMWVTDGKFDRCPNPNEPDCKPGIVPICTASAGSWGASTTLSCENGACNCLWGFNAGNFVLVRHDGIRGIAFTLYAHLQKESIRVSRGQNVHQGDQIASVGSSGNAARPHLHFGVWRTKVGSLEPTNPWGDECNGKDARHALWQADPPFLAKLPAVIKHPGAADKMTKVGN